MVFEAAVAVCMSTGSEVVPSNMDLPDLLAKAHAAMRRMPVGGKVPRPLAPLVLSA